MRKPLLALLAATVALAAAPEASLHAQGYYPSARGVDARVWVENDRDYFRRGDRLDVRFRVSDDSYVAVAHIDPEGYLEIIHPASPWDDEFVRGGRVHTVRMRGNSTWTVRSGSGIGYFYILASPTPLDFTTLRGRSGSPWDWGYAGRSVRGDPFLAFEQLTHLLLPYWSNTPFTADYYGYHVGGIHRYPAYACSNRSYSGGWGWTPNYGSCNRVDAFLRDYPYYYDTRRYRGDRGRYLRQWDRLDPRHGFKESPGQPARGVTPRSDRAPTASPPPNPRRDEGVERRAPVPARDAPRPSAPARESPARRPPAREAPAREAPPAARPAREPARPSSTSQPRGNAAPERSRPTPSAGPRSPETSGGGAAESPRRRPSPGQS